MVSIYPNELILDLSRSALCQISGQVITPIIFLISSAINFYLVPFLLFCHFCPFSKFSQHLQFISSSPSLVTPTVN